MSLPQLSSTRMRLAARGLGWLCAPPLPAVVPVLPLQQPPGLKRGGGHWGQGTRRSCVGCPWPGVLVVRAQSGKISGVSSGSQERNCREGGESADGLEGPQYTPTRRQRLRLWEGRARVSPGAHQGETGSGLAGRRGSDRRLPLNKALGFLPERHRTGDKSGTRLVLRTCDPPPSDPVPTWPPPSEAGSRPSLPRQTQVHT